ncbi:sigma 54-interacting transcriptional regulator [Candidatus Omnitrophota bacterium]
MTDMNGIEVLQEMEIRPVGSTTTEKVYARIVAATNKKNLLKTVD